MNTDDLVKLARNWKEDGPPTPPFFSTGRMIEALANRIETLKARVAELEAGLWDITNVGCSHYGNPAAEEAEALARAVLGDDNER